MMKFAFAILPLAVHGLKPRFNEDGEVDKESKSTRSEIETNPTPVQPVRSVGFGGDLGGLRPQPVQHDPRPLGGDPKGSLQSFGGDLGGQVVPTPTPEELEQRRLAEELAQQEQDSKKRQPLAPKQYTAEELIEMGEQQFMTALWEQGLQHPFFAKFAPHHGLYDSTHVLVSNDRAVRKAFKSLQNDFEKNGNGPAFGYLTANIEQVMERCQKDSPDALCQITQLLLPVVQTMQKEEKEAASKFEAPQQDATVGQPKIEDEEDEEVDPRDARVLQMQGVQNKNLQRGALEAFRLPASEEGKIEQADGTEPADPKEAKAGRVGGADEAGAEDPAKVQAV